MTKKKLLICDDAAFIRVMIRDIVTHGGYTVVDEACNGREALEKYRELKPDLLLTDIAMPEMDGIQALREIRAFDPQAKVNMVSSMGHRAMIDECFRLGAADFVRKPFQSETVLEAIKKALT